MQDKSTLREAIEAWSRSRATTSSAPAGRELNGTELLAATGGKQKKWAPLRRLAAVLCAGAVAGGLLALCIVWFWPSHARHDLLAAVQPRLELAGTAEQPTLDASATAIDIRRVARVAAKVVELTEPQRVLQEMPLYDASVPPADAPERLVTLADWQCPGARPVALKPLDEAFARYAVEIETVPFDRDVPPAVARWYAQRNAGQLQVRAKPWPISVETPRSGDVVESPFTVRGRAFESGCLQIRARTMHGLHYISAERVPLEAGKPFGPISITEGGQETYELYFLFARDPDDLPTTTPMASLPHDNPRLDIIGPVQVSVAPKYGPVRTLAETQAELELAGKMSARFVAPALDPAGPIEVSWKEPCSGTGTADVAKDYHFVLGVVHGVHVWFQSAPWRIGDDGRFDDKPVVFGVQDEPKAETEFQLWLIAVRPEAVGRIREGESWVASALPEGCIRVADVKVIKRKAAGK